MTMFHSRRRLGRSRWLLILAACSLPAWAGQPPAPNSADTAIERALEARIDIDFDHEPLDEAIKQIAAKAGIQMVIDPIVLDRGPVITFQAKDLRLSTALGLMLDGIDLDFSIRDDVVIISLEGEVNDLVRVYAVGDLVNAPGVLNSPAAQRVRRPDFDAMIEMITSSIDPDSWDDNGGAGSISERIGATAQNDAIVVTNSWRVHRKIERLLADLRAVRIDPPKAPPASPEIVVRVYRIDSPEERAKYKGATTPREPDDIGRLVEETIDPGRWKPGQLRVFKNAIIVRQTSDVQDRVLAFLLEMGYLRAPSQLPSAWIGQ